MIASLSGVLQDKSLDRVVLDVGGVGYEVLLSTQTLAALPAPGEPVRLLCHTHVREDALQLFGFAQSLERKAFELLIAVSGVGPRLALTILSGMDVQSLTQAVAGGDHKRLQGIPGVGKKTAERLVVELKERFARIAATDASSKMPSGVVQQQEDVILALVNLGYKRPLADRAVSQVLEQQREAGQTLRPEQMLREALSVITGL